MALPLIARGRFLFDSLLILVVIAWLAGCGNARPTQAAAGANCSACHGSADSPAPPRGVQGETSTTQAAVGAHRLHLRDTPIRAALPCSECHVVPTSLGSPGHLGGPVVVFGPLASAGGAAPAWDASQVRCNSVYCHGGSQPLAGGSRTAPEWTYAVEPDYTLPPEQSCTGCHGWPPPPPHPQLTSCAGCHGKTVTADGRIDVAGGKHVNGAIDFGGSGGGDLACDSCHGYPPPGRAHAAHFGWPAGAPSGEYGDVRVLEDFVSAGLLPPTFRAHVFGCGNCHPVDPSRHMDGKVEVELSGVGAPAGSVKSRNPGAASYSEGSCASVYCHSSGQAADLAAGTPVYALTPAWSSGASLGCSSCHENPPRYPSGGVGAVTANSHAGVAYDGYSFGHFGGLPGIWHPGGTFGSKHGGGEWPAPNDASPITCQSCHYDTVDPSNTGPSGFYYLDTTGDYLLPGAVTHYDCLLCHGVGDPRAPTGVGKTLPLRHVNGRRDVSFDPRETIPAIAWLPLFPFTPTRPNWVTDADPGGVPPGAVNNPETIPPPPPGQTWPFTNPTLSLTLSGASYDPGTKTCSSVACHVFQTSVQWGGAPDPDFGTCKACHGF